MVGPNKIKIKLLTAGRLEIRNRIMIPISRPHVLDPNSRTMMAEDNEHGHGGRS
jgi:hypothetical protein